MSNPPFAQAPYSMTEVFEYALIMQAGTKRNRKETCCPTQDPEKYISQKKCFVCICCLFHRSSRCTQSHACASSLQFSLAKLAKTLIRHKNFRIAVTLALCMIFRFASKFWLIGHTWAHMSYSRIDSDNQPMDTQKHTYTHAKVAKTLCSDPETSTSQSLLVLAFQCSTKKSLVLCASSLLIYLAIMPLAAQNQQRSVCSPQLSLRNL